MPNFSDCAFVFVVCGAKAHIDTLHFSLEQLKKYSQYPIYIVTDSGRNEIAINHDKVIDVETPGSYNHHQASIWLKTSLHKILPGDKRYCYLDSDVIALNKQCNAVFEYFHPPITFAKDHTTLSYFSPYAVNCDCKHRFEQCNTAFEQAISSAINHPNFPPDLNKKEIRHLIAIQNKINSNYIKAAVFYLKFILAFVLGKMKIDKEIYLNVRKKQLEFHSFYYPILILYRKTIKEKTGYSFSFLKRQWFKNKQPAVSLNRCHHLQLALKKTFDVEVPSDWQHWNGGVFVFDSGSHAFMEKWCQNTLKIFTDHYWKTRDQGTLVATVFQNTLQNHPTLPEEFNFIADFYKPEITTDSISQVLLNTGTPIYPAMIHIYHHWGDMQWDIWQYIQKNCSAK